jgi:hypothetical protein
MRSSFGRTKPPGQGERALERWHARADQQRREGARAHGEDHQVDRDREQVAPHICHPDEKWVIVAVTIDHGGTMADITHLFLRRHLRSGPTAWTRHSVGGRTRHEGVGLSYAFRARTAVISEVPVETASCRWWRTPAPPTGPRSACRWGSRGGSWSRG